MIFAYLLLCSLVINGSAYSEQAMPTALNPQIVAKAEVAYTKIADAIALRNAAARTLAVVGISALGAYIVHTLYVTHIKAPRVFTEEEFIHLKRVVAPMFPEPKPVGWGRWFIDNTVYWGGNIVNILISSIAAEKISSEVKEYTYESSASSWIYQNKPSTSDELTITPPETIKVKRILTYFGNNLQRLQNNLDMLQTCATINSLDEKRFVDVFTHTVYCIERTLGFIHFSLKKMIPAHASRERIIAQNVSQRITLCANTLCSTLHAICTAPKFDSDAFNQAVQKFSKELHIDIRLLMSTSAYKLN